MSEDFSKRLENQAEEIYSTSGSEFNIGSPKQLGEVLFDKLGLNNIFNPISISSINLSMYIYC